MFKTLNPEEFDKSAFQLIGKDWMLVTAEKDGKANTMTASWGGIGIMWGKNVAFVVIRPQRYTKEFVDSSDTLSLSFLDNRYRKTLNYLGSVSGRDEDKIKVSNLTVEHDGNTPYFTEANTVILCKKLYQQEMKPDCILSEDIIDKWYPASDFHTLYIVEIEKIMVQSTN